MLFGIKKELMQFISCDKLIINKVMIGLSFGIHYVFASTIACISSTTHNPK